MMMMVLMMTMCAEEDDDDNDDDDDGDEPLNWLEVEGEAAQLGQSTKQVLNRQVFQDRASTLEANRQSLNSFVCVCMCE
jgi:hypothetical protein